MKRYLCSCCLMLCCVLGLASAKTAFAETLTTASAINKAGRQRMLSQRMAKAYCQVGLGVEVERSRRILEESVSLFDRQLADLKTFAPTPEIKETYDRLGQTWIVYKQLLTGSEPNTESAKKIAIASEDVLKLAQQGTVQLETHSGTAAGKLINLAGRQRMLSQRIAKTSMLRAWGITSPQMAQELDGAVREFANAQELIAAAPQNTPAIRNELQLARVQWLFFEEALKQTGGSRAEQAKNIATTSERILQVMDHVTGMYEEIAR